MNKTFYFQIAVKEATVTEDKGVVAIEGFASTPDLDRYHDIVQPTAFQKALEMYMKNPVLLYQHNPDQPVGNITSAVVTEKGLLVRAEVKDATTKEQVLDGRMRAFSIGYIPLSTELQHEDGSAFDPLKDSLWDASLVRVIKALDLVEISIVSTPANGNALFTLAKSVKQYFNEVVTKSFMSKKDTEEQKPDAVVPPAEEKKPEGEPAKEGAEDAADEEEKDVEGTEGAEPTKPTEGDGTPTTNSEETEKGDETSSTDGGEGGDAEEPKAAVEPKKEGEPASEEGKTVAVSEVVAKALPELVEAGFIVKAKEAGQALDLPKGIVSVMRKLCDAYIAEAKRADDLRTKMDALPTKQPLVTIGQYKEVAPTVAAKQPTDAFKSLFNLK